MNPEGFSQEQAPKEKKPIEGISDEQLKKLEEQAKRGKIKIPEVQEESAKEIKDADSFDELYKVLRRKKEIQGSSKSYDAEDLIKIMEEGREFVRNAAFSNLQAEVMAFSNQITRSEGLRSKFLELIHRELKEIE